MGGVIKDNRVGGVLIPTRQVEYLYLPGRWSTYFYKVGGVLIPSRQVEYLFLPGRWSTYSYKVGGVLIPPRQVEYLFLPGRWSTYIFQVGGVLISTRQVEYLYQEGGIIYDRCGVLIASRQVEYLYQAGRVLKLGRWSTLKYDNFINFKSRMVYITTAGEIKYLPVVTSYLYISLDKLDLLYTPAYLGKCFQLGRFSLVSG